jgi:Synergist-CTERM protein sorting domain-containing protein
MPETLMDGHEIGYYGVGVVSGQLRANSGVTDLEATPSTNMNNPSMAVVNYALDKYAHNMRDDVVATGLRFDHYQNGSTGWTTNSGIGRAYYGLMGSVSMLVEVRGGSSHLMDRRSFAHLTAAKSMLNTLYDNASETKNLVKAGRDGIIAKGKVYDPEEKVYLYQYASGTKHSTYTGVRDTLLMSGDLIEGTTKTLALNDTSHFVRSRPTAYIVPKGNDSTMDYDYLLEMLDANRIEWYELPAGVSAPVRQYYYVSGSPTAGASTSATISNNVLRADLRDEEIVTFDDGAYVIPLDQVTGAVAVMVFEPDNASSNGFNASVAQGLSSEESYIVVTPDPATNNYPYYRLERDNPRNVLRKTTTIGDIIDELEENGCNAGFGYAAFALLAIVPFVLRRK